MSSSPLISVVMPVYNRLEYVRPAIDALLAQSEQDFELIIINNGSTDDVESFIHGYTSDKIRYDYLPQNHGPGSGYNRGVDLARGRYIAIHDSDDISHPQRLEIQSRFLNDNLHIAAVGCDLKDFTTAPPSAQPINRNKVRVRYDTLHAKAGFLFGHIMVRHPTVMLRADALSRSQLRYDLQYTISMDLDLFLRWSMQVNMASLYVKLVYYRKHGTQQGGSWATAMREEATVRERFWQQICAVQGAVYDDAGRIHDLQQFATFERACAQILQFGLSHPDYNDHSMRLYCSHSLYTHLKRIGGVIQDHSAVYRAYRQSRYMQYAPFLGKLRFLAKHLLQKWCGWVARD